MLTVYFSDEDRINAELHQEKRTKVAKNFKSRTVSNSNHDKLEFLSELAFEQLLIKSGKDYKKDEVWGGSDRYDFIVNGIRFDVKCSQKYDNKVVVNEDKLKKAKDKNTMLVGCYIDPSLTSCKIHGYCNPDNLTIDEDKWTFKGKTKDLYSLSFHELEPFKITGLIDRQII